MKKIIMLIISLLLAAMLTACSGWNVAIKDPESGAQSGAQNTSEAESDAQAENPEAETADPEQLAGELISGMRHPSWYNNNENTGLVLDYGNGKTVDGPVEFPEEWGSTGFGGYVAEGLTALIYGGVPEINDDKVTVIISRDMGESWSTSYIDAENFGSSSYRNKYIGFTSDSEGWAVLMSDTEQVFVYKTVDGGETWRETGNPNADYTCGAGYAAFITSDVGFICYGYKSDPEPVVYRTADGGESWSRTVITMPEGYVYDYASPNMIGFGGGVCVIKVDAKVPEDSDYKGSFLSFYFYSADEGITWQFYMAEE